jgi:hypothetical protein
MVNAGDKMRTFFESLIDRHGASLRSLACGRKEPQRIGFEILTR